MFRDELVTYQSFPFIDERHATHDSEYQSRCRSPGSRACFGDLTARDALTEILRVGAQKMLTAAIEKEIAVYVAETADVIGEHGRRTRSANTVGDWSSAMVTFRKGRSPRALAP